MWNNQLFETDFKLYLKSTVFYFISCLFQYESSDGMCYGESLIKSLLVDKVFIIFP